jgi:hypothetical protein
MEDIKGMEDITGMEDIKGMEDITDEHKKEGTKQPPTWGQQGNQKGGGGRAGSTPGLPLLLPVLCRCNALHSFQNSLNVFFCCLRGRGKK